MGKAIRGSAPRRGCSPERGCSQEGVLLAGVLPGGVLPGECAQRGVLPAGSAPGERGAPQRGSGIPSQGCSQERSAPRRGCSWRGCSGEGAPSRSAPRRGCSPERHPQANLGSRGRRHPPLLAASPCSSQDSQPGLQGRGWWAQPLLLRAWMFLCHPGLGLGLSHHSLVQQGAQGPHPDILSTETEPGGEAGQGCRVGATAGGEPQAGLLGSSSAGPAPGEGAVQTEGFGWRTCGPRTSVCLGGLGSGGLPLPTTPRVRKAHMCMHPSPFLPALLPITDQVPGWPCSCFEDTPAPGGRLWTGPWACVPCPGLPCSHQPHAPALVTLLSSCPEMCPPVQREGLLCSSETRPFWGPLPSPRPSLGGW